MKYIWNILFFVSIFLFNQIVLGQNYKELKMLQEEYNDVLKRQSLQKPSEVAEAEKVARSTALPDKLVYSRKDIESLLINTEKLLEQLKFLEDSTIKMPYVGYDIFTQRDTIPFWQNLPIPNYYSLGPGDEVIISLWGETNSSDTQVINRDGQIYIKNIGVLNLGGKTVNEAKKYVISKYSRVYSTLLGENPKSFIDLTLGELKSVNVHFVGFVNIPGVHMIHPFSNVITGLTQAGGISNKGSLREISIIRNGEQIGTIDIYNYMFKGKSVGELRLIDQDIVYVPPRKSTISLTGQIRKPGYYESINLESVDDIIRIAGGKEVKAGSTVLIYKNNFETYQNGYLLDLNQSLDFTLSDGDSIHIPLKPNINQFVYIEGQIKNSGKYPFQKDMKLEQLIDATMSLEDKDFFQTVDLSKIIVNRKNPQGDKPISIVVDMKSNDFVLENGDHITVPRTNYFQPIESAKITGEVIYPGVYPVNNLTSLSTFLDLAGGYSEDALERGIEVFRDSLKIAWDNGEFILQEGDSLNVLKKSGLVLVSGEVNKPGYLNYKKGDSIKKYIKRAGGFSAFAETRDVVIIYPNGVAIPNSRWASPNVLEGSNIVVNQRRLSGSSKGPSGWEAFTLISSQAGNIATTLLTIILLLNQTTGTSG